MNKDVAAYFNSKKGQLSNQFENKDDPRKQREDRTTSVEDASADGLLYLDCLTILFNCL